MIPIFYLRSSSYNSWEFCPHKFFLTYVLGMKEPSNKKADKGSIVHKALEILAQQKLAKQQKVGTFTNDEVGVTWKTAKMDPELAIEVAWEHYTQTLPTIHEWAPVDKRDVREWMWRAMGLANGQYDPTKRTIVMPEQYFDLTIPDEWARYEYDLPDGTHASGQLSIKGTIDLVCAVDGHPTTIELVDWKTGQRKDWAKDKVKEWKDLRNDPQLRMYHYALSMLMPKVKEIIVSIIFINDGGAYSLDFCQEDLEVTKEVLHKRFDEIRYCERPRRLYPNWKCNKLCFFGKNKQPEMNKTICAHLKDEIVTLGTTRVIKKYGSGGSPVSEYGDGGGRIGGKK